MTHGQPRPDQPMTGFQLFQLLMYLLKAPGLVLTLAVTRSRQVGRRVAVMPPVAVGAGIIAVLVGSSNPPYWLPLMVALTAVAVIRHRLYPAPGHSLSVGVPVVLPHRPEAGRFLVSLMAVTGGLALMAQETNNPHYGAGVALVWAGVGQVVLWADINRRERLRELDARDAYLMARERAANVTF